MLNNSNILNIDNVDISKDTKLKKICIICYPESLPDTIDNIINSFISASNEQSARLNVLKTTFGGSSNLILI